VNPNLNDMPEDVVNRLGDDKEVKMPPGYNPSDDSEDDYTPGPTTKGKRKDDSDFDSEEESRVKKARHTPGRKPKYCTSNIATTPKQVLQSNSYKSSPNPTAFPTNIKPEPGQEETISCVVCKKTLNVDTNARFHYSDHFYEANAFLSILKPDDLKDGKAQDEAGKVFKYTCPHDGCTKRKMGYKEICIHLATAHQQLRQLMMEDKRPGMKEVVNKLYPPEPSFSSVKVKQEKGVLPSVGSSLELEVDNSEDVDDPTESESNAKPGGSKMLKVSVPLLVKPAVKIKQQLIPKAEVKSEGKSMAPRVDKVHNCLVCNAPGRSNKEGRSLNLGSGLQELKYHYSVCVYNEGGLVDFIDPGQGKGVQFKNLEEYGSKFRYKCPFINCNKNQGRSKPIGYKEYAIHCGVAHHQVEKWMLEDKRSGIMEVYAAVVAAREGDGIEFEEMPGVVVEEMHTCVICGGVEKEGRNLSFEGSKIFQTRYHYASCYYGEGAYLAKYPPGPQNTNAEGGPKDVLGKEVKYSCQERGCTVKRKMGYKEFSIHMSNEHGGLEEVMKEDHRADIRLLANKIQKKKK